MSATVVRLRTGHVRRQNSPGSKYVVKELKVLYLKSDSYYHKFGGNVEAVPKLSIVIWVINLSATSLTGNNSQLYYMYTCPTSKGLSHNTKSTKVPRNRKKKNLPKCTQYSRKKTYTDKTLSLCVMIFVTPPRLGSLSTLRVLEAISAWRPSGNDTSKQLLASQGKAILNLYL